MVNVARSKQGAVDLELAFGGGGGVRCAPETTDAFPLTCMFSLTTLAKVEVVGLMAVARKMLGNILAVVEWWWWWWWWYDVKSVASFACFVLSVFSIHVGLPEMVANVV